MPRVDFYIIDNTHPKAAAIYLCRLIAKVYQRKHKLYVHCASDKEAHFYDDLLWTYEDDSFIPHHLVSETLSPPPPVQLGCLTTPPTHCDVLLNLNETIPDFYAQFNRVLEVVPNDPKHRELSRQHYRFYKKNDCPVNSHEVQTTA